MPRGGRFPVDPEKVRGKHRLVPMTDLADAPPAARARALPGATRMTAATRRWWNAWTSSPQAGQFLETDWQRLEMVAVLVDRFYRCDDDQVAKTLLAEIRLNEELLGGTPVARLRLRWRTGADGQQAEPRHAQAGKPASRRPDPRLALVKEQRA